MRRLLALLLLALGLLGPSLDAQARTQGVSHGLTRLHIHSQVRARALSRIRSRASLRARPRSGYVSFQPQVRGLGCLQPRARAMISHLTARIGPIQITSTCGGRHVHNSQHYRGNAIDFRPRSASVGAALAALRSMPEVGGIGSYPGGLIHADVGTREASWYGHRGFRAQYASLKRKRR